MIPKTRFSNPKAPKLSATKDPISSSMTVNSGAAMTGTPPPTAMRSLTSNGSGL